MNGCIAFYYVNSLPQIDLLSYSWPFLVFIPKFSLLQRCKEYMVHVCKGFFKAYRQIVKK